METSVAAEEFITIVPVGESKPAVKDPAFVTVLTVGAATGAAEVVVCRPRGARLGLGLKFEGGSAAAEKVRRLLVQSCAEDSPAANAITPWGKLIPGDEILAIDGISVAELTRIDCVRRLKDSDETLTLLVRHFEIEDKEDLKMESTENVATPKQNVEVSMPMTLPPPVPPRKLGKKNSFKEKPTLQTVGEQNALVNIDGLKSSQSDKESVINGQHTVIPTLNKLSRKSSFDSHIHRQSKEGIAYFKKGSPEEVRRLVRRLSDGKNMPPEAEIYIDLLSNEWERCLVFADAESDDTGSSISTVVDRLGSMASSVENSIPSTPIMPQKSIDIQKVLNCIENIDTNILKDMTNAKFLERQIDINNECKKLEKSSATNTFANHEAIIQNNYSEAILQSKKVLTSDNNNNHALTQNNIQKIETNETSQTIEKVITKQEIISDKPKPMPRNTKIERTTSEKKRRPIPIPEPITSASEPLLTPTKKNCIENWLQRSEAEMNNKVDDKFEDISMPEILPRLIDFVPKNQFRETTETPPCTRPTAPPPPPPAETREDGSGASLDTIGELDESTDVTDSAKSTIETEKIKRKSSFEGHFWDDRVNKSDAEDKSLSNDETPLPTCPRQPPDGVETPSDAIEKTPELPSRLPPRLSASWLNTTRPRYSYTSRTQDARSEASVKDKIAMFSTDVTSSSDRLDKCGTLPTRTHSTLRKSTTPYIASYPDVSSLDRRLTKSQDNLDETPRSFKRHLERPEVLGAIEHSVTDLKTDRYLKPDITNKPLFYGSTTTLPSYTDASFSRTTYHARSVSDDSSNKNISTHKSNLEYLIEQRKKSMSKLRGLVIPEVQAPIVDLPEIKVQDSLSKTFLQKFNHNNGIKNESKTNITKPIVLNDTKWKTSFLTNNIPKYSPAFKRKSLQVYSPTSFSKESTPERNFINKIDTLNKINNKNTLSSPLRTSLDTSKSVISNANTMKQLNKKMLSDIHEYKNVEIKICTATDIIDSDNDSAMSSTQSSYRSSASSPMQNIEHVESDNSRLSPRIPHYPSYSVIKNNIANKSSLLEKNGEDYIKRNVCRSVSSDTNISLSSSAGSAATSGSQASCSSLESSVTDSDKRKVSRTYNIDTINRRNILASAKCRSGRDLKLKSPVVETKFSHESHDRTPSPTHKTPERLSTLTSSVSAIANKGEIRRRNKVIADSDSDSDNDVNIRQRKTEYKNTRLKRNSSNSSKNKQNETDTIKVEDAPIFIKDKIMKEMNKAGLDTFNTNNNKSPLVDKSNVQHNTPDIMPSNKKDYISNVHNKHKEKLDNTKTNGIAKDYSEMVNNKNHKNLVGDIKVPTQIIKLKRGAGTGVGLILAGGIDCEAKDVTVHRVLADSIAAKAGLKRGAKIRSINGSCMLGLTHAQSVTILKEQRSEVVIEVVEETPDSVKVTRCGSETAESKDCHVEETRVNNKNNDATSSIVTVLLEKAGGGAGLGFGLDGGRDSPNGDRPLTIKKLFAGGAAAQSGRVLVGAELLSAGGQSMEGLTRTQAWAALKALPAGQVTLVLRNHTSNE